MEFMVFSSVRTENRAADDLVSFYLFGGLSASFLSFDTKIIHQHSEYGRCFRHDKYTVEPFVVYSLGQSEHLHIGI